MLRHLLIYTIWVSDSAELEALFELTFVVGRTMLTDINTDTNKTTTPDTFIFRFICYTTAMHQTMIYGW